MSNAATLGEVAVRSALGEPLDALIPIFRTPGETLDRNCFAIVPGPVEGVASLDDVTVSLQRSLGRSHLRLRSGSPVGEPAVSVNVRAACPDGSGSSPVRTYVMLLDPRAAASAPPGSITLPAAEPLAATVSAQGQESFASLAKILVPRDRRARSAYLASMRAANPALASLRDDEPFPAGAPVALPDLRSASRVAPQRLAAGAAPSAAAERARSTSALRASRGDSAPTRSTRRALATAASPAPSGGSAVPGTPAAASPAPSTAGSAPQRSEGFVLRLSSADVDWSRTRQFDDRQRQQLRERQTVLDADDQVAALLAMRDSLRQLETRVAELQLKLAAMPASMPERAAAAPAAPAAVAPVAPPPEPAASTSPPAAPAPGPKPEEPAPSPPPGTPSASSTATAPAPAPEAAPQEPPPKRAASSRTVPRPAAAATDWLKNGLWALVALLVALAAWLALRLRRRSRALQATAMTEPRFAAEEPHTELVEAAQFETPTAPRPRSAAAKAPPAAPAAPAERPVMASDASLATRLPENSRELRRRYIEERFPEIVNRAVVLEDADSVIKAARLSYEDGALPRAVELLQFAIEDRPGEPRTWLALFEIFRLERLSGEYAELAARFQAEHGATPWWPKVQYFGREIDPGNPLYREAHVNTLATIGPRDARRLAAAASFDPIAENWLNAPMDFQNEVLANELRAALMAQAALGEQDLVPNPMPALRDVETFTVA